MSINNELEDIKVSVKLKLATLWTSLMFLIIYLDYFALYMPGIIEDILKGRVFSSLSDYPLRMEMASH